MMNALGGKTSHSRRLVFQAADEIGHRPNSSQGFDEMNTTAMLSPPAASVVIPDAPRPPHLPSSAEIERHYGRSAHCVLGVLLDVTTEDAAMAFIAEIARERRYAVLATPNVNDLIGSSRNMAWRRALLTSSLSTADGMPLVWIARFLGLPIRERLAGADLFEALRAGRAGPLSVVFYGGSPGIAAAARREINAEHGALTAIGSVDPGFGSVEGLGDPRLIDEVNALDADLLILGLGAKGKFWIDAHASKVLRGVVVHLGAVLNFTAGSVRRAPRIVRDLGFEWAWRIVEEPALWRRYGPDGLRLLWMSVTRLIPIWFHERRRRTKGQDRRGHVADIRVSDGRTAAIAVVGPMDAEVVDRLRRAFVHAAEKRLNIALDLERATSLDTVAAGLLLLAFGMQLRMQRTITIIGTSGLIRRRLRWHGCAGLFDTIDGA